MALIDVVKKAQSLGPADGHDAGIFRLEPFWISAKESPATIGSLVHWRCIPPDDLIKLRIEKEDALSTELHKIADDNPSTSAIHGLLRPHLELWLDPNVVQKPRGKSHSSLHKLLKVASPRIGQKLLSSIVRACIACKDWDAVRAILKAGVIHGNTRPELVSVLIEEEQTFLLFIWISNVPDPRFSDLLLVVKYFLKSAWRSGKSLAAVRRFWRKSALKAISKLSIRSDIGRAEDKPNMRNTVLTDEELIERAVLLSLAVDHFQPFELCLHSILAFGHDEGVLTSMLLQLDGSEVIRLMQYLRKWLEKYSKQGALYRSRIKRKNLWIPSFSDILQWLSVLLDVHLPSLILSSDVHSELQTIQLLVKGMIDLSHRFGPIAGIVEQLQTTKFTPKDITGDHIIEYLQI